MKPVFVSVPCTPVTWAPNIPIQYTKSHFRTKMWLCGVQLMTEE
jgi:hypothetical protein